MLDVNKRLKEENEKYKPKLPTYKELEKTILMLKKENEKLLYEVRRYDQNYMNY